MGRGIDRQIENKVFNRAFALDNLYKHDAGGGRLVQKATLNYSTGIAAFWQVMEKLEYTFKIDKFYDLADNKLSYTVEIYNGKTTCHASEYSAPLAGCKAALKALEEK